MSERQPSRCPAVVAFGTYDRSAYPRVDVLLTGLERSGLLVGEINAPIGWSTADRVGTMSKPWRLVRLAVTMVGRWLALGRGRRAMDRDGVAPDVVVVPYLGHFDVVFARLLFPGRTIVLDHLVGLEETIVDRRGPDWMQAVARLVDRLALASADIVIVDTPERGLPGRRCVVVEVGADDRWFEAAGGGRHTESESPRIVFFGHFTPLQGTTTIAAALVELDRRGVPFEATLIGTGQDHADAVTVAGDLDQVDWIDWVDYEDLPAIVAGHDVALGVFGESDKARSVVPTKVFQSMAAGLPVVTSDTAPQRRVVGDGGRYSRPGDPGALADALERIIEEGIDRCRQKADSRSARYKPEVVVAGLVREVAEPMVSNPDL